MKTKFATMLDTTALSALFATIFYCWIYYVARTHPLALAGAVCAFFLVLLLCLKISKNKRKKQNLTKETELNIELIYEKIRIMPQSKVTHWLKQHIKESLQITNNFIVTPQIAYYNATTSTINKQMLEQILQQFQELENFSQLSLIIICENFEKEAFVFANSLNIKIELWNKNTFVNKLNLSHKTLNCPILALKPVKNYHYFIKYAFSPSRFKSYLLMGLVLIISSFFVLFRIYYLIFGTLLIGLSIFTLILKIKNKNA